MLILYINVMLILYINVMLILYILKFLNNTNIF